MERGGSYLGFATSDAATLAEGGSASWQRPEGWVQGAADLEDERGRKLRECGIGKRVEEGARNAATPTEAVNGAEVFEAASAVGVKAAAAIAVRRS